MINNELKVSSADMKANRKRVSSSQQYEANIARLAVQFTDPIYTSCHISNLSTLQGLFTLFA